MPSLGDRFGENNKRNRDNVNKTTGGFVVATVTPTFTVYLNGSPNAVEARQVPGLTYVVGTRGDYIHRQGQKPLCIPSA